LRGYVVELILQYSGVENLPRSMHNILSKFNSILVQIVKYEWNSTWRSFINDICESSTKNMNICENNFYILKMLSEEIFDHSKNQMTQNQILELKQQMNTDFTTIFSLCKLILENMHQAKQTLVRACLETLNAFLSWIPMYYIIYTDLIDKLVLMFPSDYLRNHALACLVEIASL
jgi:exportin-1